MRMLSVPVVRSGLKGVSGSTARIAKAKTILAFRLTGCSMRRHFVTGKKYINSASDIATVLVLYQCRTALFYIIKHRDRGNVIIVVIKIWTHGNLIWTGLPGTFGNINVYVRVFDMRENALLVGHQSSITLTSSMKWH